MRRLLFLFVAVVAAAASLAFGLSKAHATTAPFTSTSFALSDSNGPIAAGSTVSATDLVTLTATVSSSVSPTGWVQFTMGGSPITIGGASSWTLTPVAGTTTSTASVSTNLSPGAYTIVAHYQGVLPSFIQSSSASFSFTVAAGVPTYPTTTALVASPSTIVTGDSTTLTATVTPGGGQTATPQGTVSFVALNGGSRNTIATVPLVGGQASYSTSAWGVQSYSLEADYNPSGMFTDSHGNPAQYGASSGTGSLTVLTNINPQVLTNVTVAATPTEIRNDQVVQLTATITQEGTTTLGTLAPSTVEFTATSITGTATIGTADVTNTGPGTATATLMAAAWLPGSYTLHAQYFGNVYFDSSNAAPIAFTVHQAVPTTTTYIHDVHDYVGDTATLAAQVLDPNGHPVPAGELVPLSANNPTNSHCIGTTDVTGTASCTTTFPLAGTYTVTASYPGDSTYEPSTGMGSIRIDQIPTTATVTASPNPASTGGSDTLTGLLWDDIHNTPVAGETLTLSLNGVQTCTTGPTDGTGHASCNVPVSESPGTYPTAVSFGGDARYLPSSGPGTLQVIAVQPTNWTYDGASSALAGQPTSISFTLRDGSGQVMPFRNVTLDFNGTDYPATTDANGVATQAITAPATAGPYYPTAHYGGEPGYTGSDGQGTLVVSTIPTTLTYTGTTGPIYGGTPATISFVLKDSGGNVLPGQTVTETLPGGGSYTGTTDANGVISDAITAPTPPTNTTYIPHATFAGNLPYLSSAGDGSLQVTVVPTNITYTGDTNVIAGSSATISFVLKDSTTGLVLPYMPVTITLPDGSTYPTTTDAFGVASDTVRAPLVAGPYPVSESFGGQAQYLSSVGNGTLNVTTIPTSVTYVGDTTVVQGATATLAAKLVDVSNNVLPNETLTLTMSTGESCSGITNASGIASCQVVVNEATTPPGSPYPISISFGGDLPYLPSTGTGAIAVTGPAAVPPPSGWCSSAGHKCESILANPTVVSPTQLKILYADDSALPTTASLAPTAVLDGTSQLYTTFASTSGVTPNYVDSYGGSVATKYEDWLNIKIPTCLTPGAHTVRIFANDGDGDWDQYTWTIQANSDCTVVTVNPGPGAVSCSAVKCESILADPAVVSNSQLSIVAMDDSPIGTAGATAPSAVLSNGQILNVSTSATSGQPQNYVDTTGGSTSTAYETLITINLPSGLAAGSYTVRITAYDGDGDLDQWNWPITVASNGVVTSNAGSGSTMPPSQSSSSAGNFNNTAVPAGDTLWFNNSLQVSGIPATGATITFYNQTITMGSTTISVPDGQVIFSPTATTAATTYTTGGGWVTTVPMKLGGNMFASGVGYVLPSALAGGLKNVSWSTMIASSVKGVTVNWNWGAAAFKPGFPTDPTTLGVKPCDDGKASTYQNGDKAGSPENEKSLAVAGAMGDGSAGQVAGNRTGNVSVKF
ncbi:MAG TPA: Ig-like domain repeat protein [Gaiellaceae bacterium]|nr:Ig-like domain repeat protein [Gaiellaceae bacterium]